MEWIKVSDRLPEEDKDYIIQFEFSDEIRYQIAWFDTYRQKFMFFSAGIDNEDIIQWSEFEEPDK